MKVIIQGNLVDLEMITHISAIEDRCDFDDDDEDYMTAKEIAEYRLLFSKWVFIIHLVGQKKITIEKQFSTEGPTMIECGNVAHKAITEARNKLLSLWSPGTTKFEEIKI